MKRLSLLVSVSLLAAAVMVVNAGAEAPDVTFTATLTNNKASTKKKKQKTQITFNTVVNTTLGTGRKPAMTKSTLTADAPFGVTVPNKKCSKAQAEKDVKKCSGALIAEGTATIEAAPLGMPSIPAQVKIFNTNKASGDLLTGLVWGNADVMGGIIVAEVMLHVKVKNKLAEITLTPNLPVVGGVTPNIASFKAKTTNKMFPVGKGKKKKKQPFIYAPTVCDGTWAVTGVFEFSDADTATVPAESACKK